jgi:hypothetical protein
MRFRVPLVLLGLVSAFLTLKIVSPLPHINTTPPET